MCSSDLTDMKAIYSIHIALRLLSGQRNAWRRVTIPFIKDLRQQFLVWRTLDDETTDRYRAAGGDSEAAARVAVARAGDHLDHRAADDLGLRLQRGDEVGVVGQSDPPWYGVLPSA